MRNELHIGDIVLVWSRKAKIIHQLGKQTNNPNEENWFIVEFQDDYSTEHCIESEIILGYINY